MFARSVLLLGLPRRTAVCLSSHCPGSRLENDDCHAAASQTQLLLAADLHLPLSLDCFENAISWPGCLGGDLLVNPHHLQHGICTSHNLVAFYEAVVVVVKQCK